MVGPRGLRVDAPEGERWDLALELLEREDPAEEGVIYRGLGLWPGRDSDGRTNPDLFTVAVESSWDPERVTKTTAKNDLSRAHATLEELVAHDQRFRELLGDRKLQYVLLHDYGMGAVHLCVLKEGDLHWDRGFEPAQ